MPKVIPKSSKYRLLGIVGRGQFGQVFCGINRNTKELVALKELDQKKFSTKKFLRELRLLLTLQHPNIASCQGLEHHQTGRYLIMDYCEAGTLRSLIESVWDLNLVIKLELIRDILLGIDHIHSFGIIHRDIKPENILLNLQADGWRCRVSDLGIAQLKEELRSPFSSLGDTGTPAYMAPEQFYGKACLASDIYAVGVILFELITGERPFSGSPQQLMYDHLNSQVFIPESIPFTLGSIIKIALQKLPQRRFKKANDMLIAVQSAIDELKSRNLSTLIFSQFVLKSSSYSILYKKILTKPIFYLASNGNEIYQVINNFIYKSIYNGVELISEGEIKLEESIRELVISSSKCFVSTSNLKDDYNFYGFNDLKAGLPILSLKKTHQNTKIISTFEAQGNWLALAQINQDGSSFEIYNLRNKSLTNKPRKIYLKNTFPSQLIALNSRYGMAILPQKNNSTCQTKTKFFNRRGDWIEGFSLPVEIHQVTPNLIHSYQLLGVETNQPDTGILIDLKPYKIKRIPLGIIPDFVVASGNGYVLANGEGKIVLLSHDGNHLGLIEIPTPEITAITTFGEDKLLVATWLDNQGFFYVIDIRNFQE